MSFLNLAAPFASSIRIVITGGPSAGKTTLLELIQKQFHERVATAPEAASMLLRGGFVRPSTDEERVHTQRAIFNLQRELEAKAVAHCAQALGICETQVPLFCDRGSMDGGAYWPGDLGSFVAEMGTSVEAEYSRYALVLHLQAAEEGRGYCNNDIRVETAAEAAFLDRAIARCWSRHPRYVFVPNGENFISKISEAFHALERFLPDRAPSFAVLPRAEARAPDGLLPQQHAH